MSTAIDKPPMLTVDQIAERCSVTYQTVFNWIKSGRLKAKRIGGRNIRIEQEDFAAFLAAQKEIGGENVNTPRRTQTEE